MISKCCASSKPCHSAQLHAYEGGPDTSGSLQNETQSLAAKANATIDPRMEGLVRRLVATWQEWGFGQFNYFQVRDCVWATAD